MSIKVKGVGEQEARRLDTGIVVMLDALGASNFTEDETLAYMEKIDFLASEWQLHLNTMTKFGEVFGREGNQVDKVCFGSPEVIYFGDSAVLAWSITDNPENLLTSCATWVVNALCSAMENGLLLRGAISIGKYLLKDNIILGPAVADAASWYEKAQWMGAFLTPGTGMKLEKITNKNDPLNPIWPFFTQYGVPLKNQKTQPSWSLAWPWHYWFRDSDISGKQAREAFLSHLTKFQVPPGTEEKYLNTLRFFDDYLSSYKDDCKRLRELIARKNNLID